MKTPRKPFCYLDSARACLVYSHKLSKFAFRDKMASTTNSKHLEVNGDCLYTNKRYKMESNKVTVVLGAQWGDEGKGKVVDLLAVNADIVCRCQVIFYFL